MQLTTKKLQVIVYKQLGYTGFGRLRLLAKRLQGKLESQ